jgi:hypothetical protein
MSNPEASLLTMPVDMRMKLGYETDLRCCAEIRVDRSRLRRDSLFDSAVFDHTSGVTQTEGSSSQAAVLRFCVLNLVKFHTSGAAGRERPV